MASFDVDLTQNRVFSSNNKGFRLSLGELASRWKWEMDALKSEKDDWLVLTGDSEERELKRYYNNQEVYCDCCGTVIKSRPWDKPLDKYNGLCDSCLVDLGFDEDSRLKKYLFEKPEIESVSIRIDGEKKRR